MATTGSIHMSNLRHTRRSRTGSWTVIDGALPVTLSELPAWRERFSTSEGISFSIVEGVVEKRRMKEREIMKHIGRQWGDDKPKPEAAISP